jgi:hypothetical protein
MRTKRLESKYLGDIFMQVPNCLGIHLWVDWFGYQPNSK